MSSFLSRLRGTVVLALYGAAQVLAGGFNGTCESWNTTVSPDSTQFLLVARCYNSNYMLSGSTSDIVCSQLNLNDCLEPGDDSSYKTIAPRPKESPNDKTWFPVPCSVASTNHKTKLFTGCTVPSIGGVSPTPHWAAPDLGIVLSLSSTLTFLSR
ncbi:hypothetical protein F5Y15DRAFT_384706 [Xylariaceae sp. FL0016]|nr:hypothetical protein F5Y15DRAFT_384706 [Xylariaceae sp. FL0016]